MASQPLDMFDDDLHAQLADLGRHLEWASTPDLAAVVVASMSDPVLLPASSRRRAWLAAAAIVLLLIGAALAGSGSVRSTVADFLGIDGLRIERGAPETTPVRAPDLGTPTSMQDLIRWLPFTPMLPSSLGTPDAVYLRVLENGDMLGMTTWEPSESLPETAETGVGALLMQFDAPGDIYMMLKTVGLSTGRVTETTLSGGPAFWVEGASDLAIFGRDGIETRPTANVLIWERGGVGFRFESNLTMEQALAIAETMAPLGRAS